MSGLLSPVKRVEGIHYLDYSPVAVEMAAGRIVNIERLKKISAENDGILIAPGLIDIQVNGYDNVSFSLEGAEGYSGGNNLTTDDVKTVTEGLWKEGVTTYFPTLTTNSQALLVKNFATLAVAKEDPALFGSIPGFHLEGPYISAVDGYVGAHPREHVRKPDWQQFLEMYKASGEKILLVTLAPEIDGAFDFIRKCRENGIVVSLGHHNGSAAIIKQSIDNGALLATHLGNGCAPLINRHSNPIWPQLSDDRLMISMICDSFHLPPDLIRVFYKAKGVDKIIITSDITSYAGLPSGRYKIKSGEVIEKTPDGNTTFSGQAGGLYGSATPLPKAIGHIMKVTGCSLANAIQMATRNPAHLHNLSDRGTLEPGKRADIILFTMDHFNMKIQKTIVEGNLVFELIDNNATLYNEAKQIFL
jgi:N-acetylglucosamine-6-phosphate deacetylase